jgi:hypothetical protein
LRTYTDPEGTTWNVYSVAPGSTSSPRLLPEEYRSGWLCFEAGAIKRRLVPIPDDWELCDERDLDAYRVRAAVALPRLAPTSDGRNAPVGALGSELPEIERAFARRLPASLSVALHRFAERLNEPDAPAEFRPAIPGLKLAAQAADHGDLEGAREQYRTAAVFFAAALGLPGTGDVSR